MRVSVTSGPLGSLLGATVTSAVSGSMSAAVGLQRRLRAVASLPAPPPAWRGSGPVVLVGGLCTTDAVLQPMRLWLERLGYQVLVHTAGVGLGCGARGVEAVRDRLDEAADLDRNADGVRLVGYSRGGQFARVAAAGRPVRALVTIGTPFELYPVGAGALLPVAAVTAAGTLGMAPLATVQCLFGPCCATFRRSLRLPVDGPFTSIYSRRDKVVPWRTSVDPVADNIEVEAGHLGLVSSPTVLQIIAETLAPAAVAA
jgi:pimeloyl-ACP methyl ester carboxylesterase